MTWGYLRAQAGHSRVCQGPRGKLMLWPQVVCKKMKESLGSAEEGICVHLPHRPRWASVRCGLIQELPVCCGPSSLCSLQCWFHSQALGVAGQLSAEPDPRSLRVPFPPSPRKI